MTREQLDALEKLLGSANIVTVDDMDHEGEGSTPLEAIQNARGK